VGHADEPEEPEVVEDDPDGAEPDRRELKPRRGTSSVLAAAMLGLRDALEGPKKETIVIQVDAAGDPPNIDLDGLDEELSDEHRMSGPPLDDIKGGAAPRPAPPARTRSRMRSRPRRIR
jgi:hypothetical protein